MLVGAHVSVAGGYHKGIDYGLEVGAECIQIFAKSPRQWRGPAVNLEAADAFISRRRETGFGPVFTHTAYLLNLSTVDDALRTKTVAALADELVRGAALRVDGVCTHVGNDPEGDPERAAARAASVIREAYELAGHADVCVRLLLENTAGAGRSFGCCFAELASVIRFAEMPASQLGACFDTCHGHAYGMSLTDRSGWDATVAEIAETIGLDRLGLIHANDCMFERGSKRDRHAWIGDGFIGFEGFEAMLCNPDLDHVPAVTEMPGDVPLKDEVNLERLKTLRESCDGGH
jgi:deoxyribonuclease-4